MNKLIKILDKAVSWSNENAIPDFLFNIVHKGKKTKFRKPKSW